MTDILTVRKSTLELPQGVVLDIYTADEIDEFGRWVNYLSGRGLADSVKVTEFMVRAKRMSKALKAKLGKDFMVRAGRFELSKNRYSDVTLWRFKHASKFWVYQNSQGNEDAGLILEVLADVNLQIMSDEAFGRGYEPGKAQELVRKYEQENQQLKNQLQQAKKTIKGQEEELREAMDNYDVQQGLQDEYDRQLRDAGIDPWKIPGHSQEPPF
ncbi:hypothetical protein [Moorena sp. SIO3I8]|uniref:hypothetical protein n=1 Tax=Moorena sp. SIO3I8 TaxID=2607833 RepID=UPI0013C1A94E|nr:hypothetical protein [Moorena sp. SIO3I8]NEO08450.1 hypothetical protein [Moorena sp. SIO3I8]